MGILNIGTQALQANQAALQTVGNNIANVNTTGYSRQSTILVNIPGQFTGGGYIGKGVGVKTIQRNFSEFLTRQAALSSSMQASDVTRADKLKQLEGIFGGGKDGLGASISDMMNAFSDVAASPTDLTARTVVLTRLDETAARMRSSQNRLDDLQNGITQELKQKVNAINNLAQSIAEVNQEIARVKGNGQPPNDLLDRRDQLVRELGNYVQTTTILADDGTLGVFIGGSQSLVLGTLTSKVSIEPDDYGDPLKNKLAVDREGTKVFIDEKVLGGGEVSGLLRFQNADLVEGRNLLGRLTLSITTSLNEQHKLGLDLDGKPGDNLLSPISFSKNNILEPKKPASLNTGGMSGLNAPTLNVYDVSQLVAADYVLEFNPTGFTITRSSDGKVFDQTQVGPLPTSSPGTFAVIDGLEIQNPSGGVANPGDRFLFKPFSTSAGIVRAEFTTPRALAVSNLVVGNMGITNKGSLQQVGLVARSNPALASTINPPFGDPVTLTFTSPNTYTRSDDPGGTVFNYLSGEAIESTFPDIPLTQPPTYSLALTNWSLKLQGSPQAGDTFTISDILDPALKVDFRLNAGNAGAISNLRDKPMFDGAALTDGYAGLISQIGIRTQSANYAADVSTNIAANVERDRAGVSGVNLDEEAAKLLQYQQAYQASAKMVQIAQSIFESLLQGLAR